MENSQRKQQRGRRSRYNKLLSKVEEIDANDNHGSNILHEIGDIFNEINEIDRECPLDQRVDCLEENLMDCTVVRQASGTFIRTVESFNVEESTYESSDFAQRLLASVDEGDGWQTLQSFARNLLGDLPKFNSIYGAIDLDVIPEVKVRKQIVKDKEEAVKTRPVKIVEAKKEEDGMDDTVNFIFKILKKEYETNGFAPMDYFAFVVDSESFAQTIENMFYFSFLVKDGKASFVFGKDDGVPKIEPVRGENLKKFRDNNGANTQIINCITHSNWESLRTNPGLLQKYQQTN